MYGVASDKRIAFRGRIKHFQRMRFPGNTNTGKGVPARFSFNRLMQLVFAFELVQSGLDPSAARSVMSEHWPTLSPAVARSMVRDVYVKRDPLGFPTGELSFAFYFDGLWSLTVEGDDTVEYYGAVDILPAGELARPYFNPARSEYSEIDSPWRVLLIEVSQLVNEVVQRLIATGFQTSRRELFEDLAQGESEWEDPYKLEIARDAF